MINRKICAALIVMTAFFIVACGAGQTTGNKLPVPVKTGGAGIFDLLEQRSSMTASGFSADKKPISKDDLSAVLWAANGRNRNGGGWVVPFARGADPYCSIYVVGADGAYLYEAKTHSLKEITGKNIKAEVGTQGFVKDASHILVFVDNTGAEGKTDGSETFGAAAVGAMTQNVYLAAADKKIGVRYIVGANRAALQKHLALPGGDRIVCILPMSYR